MVRAGGRPSGRGQRAWWFGVWQRQNGSFSGLRGVMSPDTTRYRARLPTRDVARDPRSPRATISTSHIQERPRNGNVLLWRRNPPADTLEAFRFPLWGIGLGTLSPEFPSWACPQTEWIWWPALLHHPALCQTGAWGPSVPGPHSLDGVKSRGDRALLL